MVVPRFLIAACLFAGVAPAQLSGDASIGVWPWLVGNIDSYQDEIIGRAKSTGLDTIYVSLWRTTGRLAGTLNMVDEARTWNTADGQLVPQVTLSTFLRKAHAAGIQVVGVVKVFESVVPASDYVHQDHIVKKVIRYLVHSYDGAGQPVYPLDGIALDYIRWFGGNHTSTEVNRFLDETRREVGALPIHAYVIASPYALDAGTYNNTFRSYIGLIQYLTQNYGQHWEEMAARIDCLMPMTYIAEGGVYGRNLGYMEGYTRQAASYARSAVSAARSNCRVVLAVRTWNSTGETTTQASVEASCRGAMQGGADGFMAFRYFTARGQTSWFQGLANHAVAGQDLPVAALSGGATGLSVTLDSSRSFHTKFATSRLVARIDLDGDGRFELGPATPGKASHPLNGLAHRIVSLQVTDPLGRSAVARLAVSPQPIFSSPAPAISALSGGTVFFRLSPGPTEGGQRYLVFASLSGVSPGTPLGPGLVVPLNVDPLTLVVFAAGNTPMLQRFHGVLDPLGTAQPVFAVGPNVIPGVLAGSLLSFAAVGVDRTSGQPRFASNPVSLRILQ